MTVRLVPHTERRGPECPVCGVGALQSVGYDTGPWIHSCINKHRWVTDDAKGVERSHDTILGP
jgi:tRNA(Ile2) C34 agmatinyltransferase TiaS